MLIDNPDHYIGRVGGGSNDRACLICGKRYSKPIKVRMHIVGAHDKTDRKLPCPECGSNHRNKYALRAHITKRHKYPEV